MSNLKENSNNMKINNRTGNMKKYSNILNNVILMGTIFVHIN